MAPDCESPQCHEAMRLSLDKRVKKDDFDDLKRCMHSKVSRKTLWIIATTLFPFLLIVGGIGIKGWSQQEADHLRYAEKTELTKYQKEVVRIKVVTEHMAEDLQELKEGQKESQKDLRDIKDILIRMKDKNK